MYGDLQDGGHLPHRGVFVFGYLPHLSRATNVQY